MMTYGWAILIIVIVAGVLYSLGIFSPSSAASTTITGFSGLGSPTALCMANGGLRLQLGNNIGQTINITMINVTANGVTQKIRPNKTISPQGTYIFYVQNVCGNSAWARYSFTSSVAYTEPGQVFPGPYFSSGTASGTVSSTPLPGKVAYFNGQNAYVANPGGNPLYMQSNSYINTTSKITGTNQSFTISMWIYVLSNFSAPNSSVGHYFGTALAAFDNYQAFDVTSLSDHLLVHRCTPGDIYVDPQYESLLNGQWHFAAFSVSPSVFYGQVDSNGASTTNTKQYSNNNLTRIGATYGCVDSPFIGYISNVQIYNTALSQTQLLDLYGEGILGAPLNGAGIVDWWPLNNTAKDIETGITGTFHGSSQITSNFP